jgi:hypothetical protein
MYINHTFLVQNAITFEEIMDIDPKLMHKDGEKDTRIFPICDKYYMWAIAVCLIYPMIYDGTQLIK